MTRTSFFKKAPQRILRVSDPTRISPFAVPTRKEAPTGIAPMGVNSSQAVTSRFLPTGENKTSKAPRAVFDPTQEKRAWTPLPNDSFKASSSPPVGGRLRSSSRDWQTNYCSSNVLNLITNGYILPFLSKPNLVRFSLIISEYKVLPRTKPWPIASTLYCQRTLSKGWKM